MSEQRQLYAVVLEKERQSFGPGDWCWKVTELVREHIRRQERRESLAEAVGLMAEWTFARALLGADVDRDDATRGNN